MRAARVRPLCVNYVFLTVSHNRPHVHVFAVVCPFEQHSRTLRALITWSFFQSFRFERVVVADLRFAGNCTGAAGWEVVVIADACLLNGDITL